MTAKRGKNSSGCGALIGGLLVLSLIAFVIGQIARAFTGIAIWMQYGSAGLPDPTNRSPAYGLAWGLFFGTLLTIGLAVAVIGYELSRRRRFVEFVSTLRVPERSG